MENGRIEPLRALPVHGKTQPCFEPKCLKRVPHISASFRGAWRPLKAPGGLWRFLNPLKAPDLGGLCSPCRLLGGFCRPLQPPGGAWPLEAPEGRPLKGGPWRPLKARLRRPVFLHFRPFKKAKKTIFSRWELRA